MSLHPSSPVFSTVSVEHISIRALGNVCWTKLSCTFLSGFLYCLKFALYMAVSKLPRKRVLCTSLGLLLVFPNPCRAAEAGSCYAV